MVVCNKPLLAGLQLFSSLREHKLAATRAEFDTYLAGNRRVVACYVLPANAERLPATSLKQDSSLALIRRPGTINRGQFFSQQRPPREEHGVEFRADQDYEGDEVHPHQQCDSNPERAVNDAVVRIVRQVE